MIAPALLAVASLGIAGALALDIALRVMGLGGFPLYARDPASTYRMASDQQGRFRRRARWRFDRFGIRTDDSAASLAGRIVLLGDSVVEGGIHLDQDDTLAAIVARDSGWAVSAVACHGWALSNELGALTTLPGWEQAAALVWVVNTGDFDTVGRGESELSFPTRRPLWLALWLARRHIYRARPRWWPFRSHFLTPGPHRPEMRGEALARFAGIAPRIAGPIVIVGHARRDESIMDGDIAGEPFFRELAAVRPGSAYVSPAALPGWDRDCYIDDIHPNARGARLIADAIIPNLPPFNPRKREEP
ncbi:SGNH/GDSL hydrolase family protein [Novosphingobium percolationis]|uniref:hypothetical protein n=1 Tax=Novosphingobium percolationis TaxID=2871811 RepID=UPI001CD32E17|nr:hypothetical protein [Novosphingobium percolationis]MCH7627831.1 SGNH/GDSL hydrolase family protein [Pseudomonadota bacterium]